MREVGVLAPALTTRISDPRRRRRLRDHQVVDDAAGSLVQQRVAHAGPAPGPGDRPAPASPARRACAASPRSAIWPICETSNRPALGAGVQMLGQDAGRDTAPASHSRRTAPSWRPARHADRRAGCAAEVFGRFDSRPKHLRVGTRAFRVSDPPSVLGPERFTDFRSRKRRGNRLYSFGGTAQVSGRPAFQSVFTPAVLLPESFRGGCSFGAGRRSGGRPDVLSRDRSKPRGASLPAGLPSSGEISPKCDRNCVADNALRSAEPTGEMGAAQFAKPCPQSIRKFTVGRCAHKAELEAFRIAPARKL